MDIRYSNIKRPSDDLTVGYSILEYQMCLTDDYSIYKYQTSICRPHRWIFDIRISNVHLTTSQMDIQYSNIKRPSDDLTDGYSIFECQTSI